MQTESTEPNQPISLSFKERVLRGWVQSFLALNGRVGPTAFCSNVPVELEGKVTYYKPHVLHYLLKKIKRLGDEAYRDLRTESIGGASLLSARMKTFLTRNYILNVNSTFGEHLEALKAEMATWTKDAGSSGDSEPIPSYYSVRRHILRLPWFIHIWAEFGKRRARELYCGCPLAELFQPWELFVGDTITLTKVTMKYKGKWRPIQVTFLMDASSRFVAAFIVHFKDATHAEFMGLLQKALLSRVCGTSPLGSALYQVMACLLTDNGSISKHKAIAAACADLMIKRLYSDPYCPNANGRAEAMVKIIRHRFEEELVRFQKAFTEDMDNFFGSEMAGETDIKIAGVHDEAAFAALKAKIASLFEKYNQTPKAIHGKKSPSQVVADTSPAPATKTRTKEEILRATRVKLKVTPNRGCFTFRKQAYRCVEAQKFSGQKLTIVVDPCGDPPLELELIRRGRVVGVARHNKAPKTSLKDCKSKIPSKTADAQKDFDAQAVAFGIADLDNKKDPNRPYPTNGRKPKPVKTDDVPMTDEAPAGLSATESDYSEPISYDFTISDFGEEQDAA